MEGVLHIYFVGFPFLLPGMYCCFVRLFLFPETYKPRLDLLLIQEGKKWEGCFPYHLLEPSVRPWTSFCCSFFFFYHYLGWLG